MRRLALPLRGSLLGLLALGVVVGTAGCSSSDEKSDTTTSKAPEDVLVSNARVATGLASLGTIATGAADQVSSSAKSAKASADRAEQQWQAIEGRIKANDTGAYLKFEDALSDLRTGAADGDAVKVRRGAAAIATVSAAYLVKYPG